MNLLLPILLFLSLAVREGASSPTYFGGYELISNTADTSKPEIIEIFKIAEEMPRFPGCENKESIDKKKQCSQRELLNFIYEEIVYPKEAKKNNISGMVVVQFLINIDGSVSNIKAIRDIGAGCAEEAVRVVELMNKRGIRWIPGKNRGQKVPVQFNLPVNFKLKKDGTKSTPKISSVKGKKKGPFVSSELDKMPYIKDCGKEYSEDADRMECTKNVINKAKLKYGDFQQFPSKEDLRGIAIVECIIEKNGSISEDKIFKPLCRKCDKEALRQVRLMHKNDLHWVPGKIDGKPVRSTYLIAIPFEK
jgi:TonB family protein